jgi:hypothetical protein
MLTSQSLPGSKGKRREGLRFWKKEQQKTYARLR